jgi:hypothetical protein
VFPVGDITTMMTVDVHYSRRPNFGAVIRSQPNVYVLEIAGGDNRDAVYLYLSEEQLDSIGETILAHQSQRKRWSTARVIDNQLLEVKKEEDHGLCVP